MKLITQAQQQQMFRNHVHRYDEGHDPEPVVKLFTPWAGATWLLTELDPDSPDIAFGLCDLGLGCPELGSVSLAEITSLTGPGGLRVERDLSFEPTKTLSAYTKLARQHSGIVC